METEGGHGRSVTKRRNLIEIGLVRFVLARTSVLDDVQILMVEAKVGYWNSVIKHNFVLSVKFFSLRLSKL